MADTFYPFYLDYWGGQTELKTPNPKKVAEEVKKILEDAPEEYDTFKEVADELDSTSDKLTSVEENVSANANAISILNGDASTEGSVANTVATEIAKVVDSAPETLDTLKEVADYIEQHETETAEIKKSIANESTAREGADTALQAAVDSKADADSVYTKSEVDTKISKSSNEMTETAVALANSLTEDINDAKTKLQSSIDAEATTREGADATLQGNIDAEATAREGADATLQGNIDAEATAREGADTTLQGKIDAEATDREEADTALQAAVDSKADADSVYTKSEVDTKISKSSNEMTETAVALANSLTEDINNAKTNLQSSIDAEATAREDADTTLQANIDANTSEITATKSEVDEMNNSNTSSIAQIQAMITALQSKVASLTTSGAATTINSAISTTTTYNNSGADYVVSASISGDLTITDANSVTLTSDVTISNNARLKVTAEDIELDGVTVSGNFDKETSNATISLNGCKYVTIKDTVFDSTYSAYNGYEIGLGSSEGCLPVSVIIDNCQFLGENSNNVINIFGTESNAIVTISNCYFKKVSNVLRLSNKTNAKNVTVNVVNCTVDEWETSSPYQGFLLCQDYTNTASADYAKEQNIFGPGKLSINFTNLVHNGEKVLPTDISNVCGTSDENQVIYVYRNAEGEVLAYDEDCYPSITFA